MRQSAKIRFDAIINRIPDHAERILDVGCARHGETKRQSGNLHEELHRKTEVEIVGIDILEEEIEKMRKEGYDVHVGDAENIQFDELFDVVVAGEVIEHLNNPGKILTCINCSAKI